MKARLRGSIAATALVGTLALSGCGSSGSGTAGLAATVDGDRIATADVMAAAQQINEQFKPQTPLTTSDALNLLIVAPAIIATAAKDGNPTTFQAARTRLTDVMDPNDATITLVQSNEALATLTTSAQQQQALAAIEKLDVSVNPRFGTFDHSQPGLVAPKPAWISKTVAPPTSATPAP